LRHTCEQDKDYNDYLKIKEVFDKSKGKYGWRSIKMRLPQMNHKKIQRIMKKYDLRTKVRRKNPYKAVMKAKLEHRVFPNKLQREFKETRPFKVFCTDITYLPFLERFVYLLVIKDIASGEVVGWNASLRLDMALVIETICKMKSFFSPGGLIHSDQGLHYTNPSFIKTIKNLKLEQSMSGKGNCIDNAPIETFFGHMKDELEYDNCRTFDQMSSKIEEYMRYYNHERKQWARNKMAPVEYRNHLLTKG
jgi:putative transposase